MAKTTRRSSIWRRPQGLAQGHEVGPSQEKVPRTSPSSPSTTTRRRAWPTTAPALRRAGRHEIDAYASKPGKKERAARLLRAAMLEDGEEYQQRQEADVAGPGALQYHAHPPVRKDKRRARRARSARRARRRCPCPRIVRRREEGRWEKSRLGVPSGRPRMNGACCENTNRGFVRSRARAPRHNKTPSARTKGRRESAVHQPAPRPRALLEGHSAVASAFARLNGPFNHVCFQAHAKNTPYRRLSETCGPAIKSLKSANGDVSLS